MEHFWTDRESFLQATGAGKKRRKIVCTVDGCSGVLFSVEQPLIRRGMGHETYQCDKCKSKHVVQVKESQ